MPGFESLALAVRPPVVARYFGELMIGVAVMIAVTASVGLAVNDVTFAGRAALMLLLALVTALFCRRFPAQPELQVNEALVVIALAFLAGSALMIWPLMSAGLDFWSAMFESISALTTTGLSTVSAIEEKAPSFLFARAWMQWFGGLVIVVLALALVITPGPAAKRLYGAEADASGIVAGTRRRGRRALAIYLMLLAVGAAVLFALGLSPFDALLHSLAAVSTGGFSTHDASIGALHGTGARFAVIGLTVCGAISLSLYPTGWRTGWSRVARDPQVRALMIAGGTASLALCLALSLLEGWSWSDSVRVGPLLAFSAQTTSGFEAAPVAELGAASKTVLILSMFIGGDVGSTAGGIKIVRFLLILRLAQFAVRRASLPPHAVFGPEDVAGQSDARESFAMLGVVSLFVLVIIVSWLPFLIAGMAPLDALFEVVSAVGTVGLTSGITDAALPKVLKLILCFDMLMGRLEIVAILLLLYPRTWFGRRADVR